MAKKKSKKKGHKETLAKLAAISGKSPKDLAKQRKEADRERQRIDGVLSAPHKLECLITVVMRSFVDIDSNGVPTLESRRELFEQALAAVSEEWGLNIDREVDDVKCLVYVAGDPGKDGPLLTIEDGRQVRDFCRKHGTGIGTALSYPFVRHGFSSTFFQA